VRAPPLPDVTKLASLYLRTVPEVVALVGNRVYSVFPSQLAPGLSFALVQRVGGPPAVSYPLVVDLALMQLDAYGGPQAAAHELAATVLSALSEWQGEQPDELGNVCGTRIGAKRWQPDETYKPPRPRYVCDFEVTVKPASVAFAR